MKEESKRQGWRFDDLRRWIDRLAYGITHPDEELTRLQKFVRYAYELTNYAGAQLARNNATLMAAGLAYRTLFSMIPVLVLSLLVLRAFVQEAQVERVLTDLLEASGLSEISVQPPPVDPDAVIIDDSVIDRAVQSSDAAPVDASGNPAQAGADGQTSDVEEAATEQAIELGVWIRDLIANAQGYLGSINFGSIAVVGVFVFMYAALSLFLQIENCFNTIYQVREHRAFSVRIVYSWALLTLGSVAITASILIGSGTLTSAVESLPGWLAWSREAFSIAAHLAITWLLFFAAYQLVPATRVRRTPSAVGAFVAAGAFELGKFGFVWFIKEGTGGQVAVYGSLALLPLFLLWVYITWIIILFGLQIAQAMQTVTEEDFWLRKREPEERLLDPLTAVTLVRLVALRFADGKEASSEDLAREVHLPSAAVARVLRRLADAGFLHRLIDDDPDKETPPTFVLARPADSISIVRVLDALHGRDDDMRDSIPAPVRIVRERERAALEGLTLADMGLGGKPVS